MAREGQTKVEVRPGAFVWMNEQDRKAYEKFASDSEQAGIAYRTQTEAAAVEPAETAVQPAAKARKP